MCQVKWDGDAGIEKHLIKVAVGISTGSHKLNELFGKIVCANQHQICTNMLQIF